MTNVAQIIEIEMLTDVLRIDNDGLADLILCDYDLLPGERVEDLSDEDADRLIVRLRRRLP